MPFFRKAAVKRERIVQAAREEAAALLRSRIQEREDRVRENHQRADVGSRFAWIYGQNPAENARLALGLPGGPLPHDPEWSKLVAAYTLGSSEQRAAMFLVLAGEFVRVRNEKREAA